MRDCKDLSLKEVKAQIQIFLATWSKEELLTLVNVKVDEEIMDKYNIVTTKKQLKEFRIVNKGLKRDNRELKRIISSCQNAFAKLSSEHYIYPQTKVKLTSNSWNSSNRYEISNSSQSKMELHQSNLFDPNQTLDESNASNLLVFERLIKQLDGCVAKRKEAMIQKKHLIQECFKRFPRISLSDKNNVCHFWTAEEVKANKPMKIALQKTKPTVKARNKKKILIEVSELGDTIINSGQIHSQEMDKTIAFADSIITPEGTNTCPNIPMNVKYESELPVMEHVIYKNHQNISSQHKLDTQIKTVRPELDKKKTFNEEPLNDPSQPMLIANNITFPDFLKTPDSPSGISYYKKIQKIIRPRSKTTQILLSSKATGLENIDLAKQSSILNSLLLNNSDAALRALNKHHLIDKIDYRRVEDDPLPKSLEDSSNCVQNSGSNISQTPADIFINSECPSSTRDVHKIMPNVSNASLKLTVLNGCKQITLSTKPSCYEVADISPLVKKANLGPEFKNTKEDLRNASEKDASWAPVKIFCKKKKSLLKKNQIVTDPVYQHYYPDYNGNMTLTTPSSRVNIVKVVGRDYPYSNKLINVQLQPIPIEVNLASDNDRQPATDHRQTLNHLDPFVQSSVTISPQIKTNMDTLNKKHSSDDSTLGLGVNGVPIKKIKLSFRPLQTSVTSVKIADDSINLNVKTPIQSYSRALSPKRNGAIMSQSVTDKSQYLMEIDGSKVNKTVLQMKTEEGNDVSLYRVEDYMPQIVSVTSLPRNQASAVLAKEAPLTNLENEPSNAVPPIEVPENCPQWCVEMLKNAVSEQVNMVAPCTQTKLKASQTQVETDTQLETLMPQTQLVQLDLLQSQMVPQDSQQFKIVSPDSQKILMVPPDSHKILMVPLNSQQIQMVPPPDSSQSHVVQTNTPQTHVVQMNMPQNHVVQMNTPQTQLLPPDSPQTRKVPTNMIKNKLLSPDSSQIQTLLTIAQQSEAETNVPPIEVHTDVLQNVREKWRQLLRKPKLK